MLSLFIYLKNVENIMLTLQSMMQLGKGKLSEGSNFKAQFLSTHLETVTTNSAEMRLIVLKIPLF